MNAIDLFLDDLLLIGILSIYKHNLVVSTKAAIVSISMSGVSLLFAFEQLCIRIVLMK
jgi:hypothetical protein